MAFQKKASTTSELVLGSAVAELRKVSTAAVSAVSMVEGLAEKAEGLQLEIASKEDRIKALDVEYEEIERQKKVDLELTMKASKEQAAIQIVESQGKIVVVKSEYEAIKEELAQLKANFKEEVRSEVGAAVGIANGKLDSERKLMAAEYTAKEAGNLATIESLNKQVAAQGAEIERWKDALDKERTASVDRAKASQIGTMNVGGGYGK